MSLKLEKKHIESIKQAGKCDGKTISLLKTYGGLHIVAMMKGGTPEILSWASHPAIAKYMAEKNSKETIEWDNG